MWYIEDVVGRVGGGGRLVNQTVSQRVQLVTPTGGLDSEGLRLSARIPQTTDGQRVNGLMVDYCGHHKHLVSYIVNATPPPPVGSL